MPGVSAAALLDHLGDDSALHKRGGGWTLMQHLAVRTLEEVDFLCRIMLRNGGTPVSKLPEPLHIPRPHERHAEPTAKAKPQPVTRSWVRDLMGATGVEVVTVG